ncbi:MAG TPA: winged helix-turn-helix domain-containing protein [Nitrososphaerales archaeon]|nr:winged helix-turn-helix domain-containing protein [Nitrososphaerales archaeon]
MSSSQPSSKPDLYVVARVVNVLREKGPTKRTQLAVMTRLSYDTLVKYLDWMNQKGFVRFDEEENVVLTQQGEEVYDRLVKWILEYVGKLRFPRF